MDWKLFKNMGKHLFSFEGNNPRAFTLKRVFVLAVLTPIFLCLILVNRLFMALDHLVFPSFKNIAIKNPLFIIAMPRSATTFLHHSLAQSNKFSFFKLWEILFAPSIIQKYICLVLLYVDKKVGCIFTRLILAIEHRLIKNFKQIHPVTLDAPEEDELLFLWNFSTAYLHFLVPHQKSFEEYFYFDEKMDKKKQHRIMAYYIACIRRHEFVFNRAGKKTFLSKNPFMIPKEKTIAANFPDAKFIAIERNGKDVIASTLSLKTYLYGAFSKTASNATLEQEGIDVLVNWYNRNLRTNKFTISNQKIILQFEDLVSPGNYPALNNELSNFLRLGYLDWIVATDKKERKHKSRHKHFTLNEVQILQIEQQLNYLTSA